MGTLSDYKLKHHQEELWIKRLTQFVTPHRNEVRLISKELQFMKIFKMIGGSLLRWSGSFKIMKNVLFHIKL